MSRYLLELDGDERQVVRLLRALLKTLGRQFGVRARLVVPVDEAHP
jgi:hypothetical protein